VEEEPVVEEVSIMEEEPVVEEVSIMEEEPVVEEELVTEEVSIMEEEPVVESSEEMNNTLNVDSIIDDVSDDNVSHFNSMSVKELKQYLSNKGVKNINKNAKKGELIRMINN